jgi:hypothetical protein
MPTDVGEPRQFLPHLRQTMTTVRQEVGREAASLNMSAGGGRALIIRRRCVMLAKVYKEEIQ